MLKQVVFDLGGVVVEFEPRQYLAERFLNKPLEDFLYDHIFASPVWRQLDAGELTLARAGQLILEQCGNRRYEAQLVLDDWRDMLTTRKQVTALMEELKKAGYPLYYLSDIPQDVLEMFRRKKRFMEWFDGGVASCEEHLLKPDPAIYQRLLDRYRLSAAETVFIDDRKENVDAASAMGFTAIPYKNVRDLRQMLQFLGFPLKNDLHRRKEKPAKPTGKPPLGKVMAVFHPGKPKPRGETPKQTDIPL